MSGIPDGLFPQRSSAETEDREDERRSVESIPGACLGHLRDARLLCSEPRGVTVVNDQAVAARL